MNNYQIIVGNVGTVYTGSNGFKVRKIYGNYKRQSQENYGRAAGENVTVLMNDDVLYEHIGHNQQA